jgi:MoaA/NifB/PqqE/SkfB family radical SAM enzyme
MRRERDINTKLLLAELSIELDHKCSLGCIYCRSSTNLARNERINLDRLHLTPQCFKNIL